MLRISLFFIHSPYGYKFHWNKKYWRICIALFIRLQLYLIWNVICLSYISMNRISPTGEALADFSMHYVYLPFPSWTAAGFPHFHQTFICILFKMNNTLQASKKHQSRCSKQVWTSVKLMKVCKNRVALCA